MKILFFLILFLSISSISYSEEIGYASFYTVKSSSSLTASGETFNDNDLTAAKWDIPFGTKIKVTNLQNNKSIIVKINDRGPNKRFKNRVIDLSRGAFGKIANLKDGLVLVKLEIIK